MLVQLAPTRGVRKGEIEPNTSYLVLFGSVPRESCSQRHEQIGLLVTPNRLESESNSTTCAQPRRLQINKSGKQFSRVCSASSTILRCSTLMAAAILASGPFDSSTRQHQVTRGRGPRGSEIGRPNNVSRHFCTAIYLIFAGDRDYPRKTRSNRKGYNCREGTRYG